MIDPIATLNNVKNALELVAVRGSRDMTLMLGCINSVEDVVKQLKEQTAKANEAGNTPVIKMEAPEGEND